MSPASRIRATLSKSRAECIFVDTQPSAEGSLIQIVTEVDLCIVVVRPGQLELDALGATLAAIKAASAPAVFCVNQAHPQANLLDLQMGLQRHYPVGPIIRSRGDFPASVVKGQSVMEFNPTGKAAMEILAYWSWLQEELP
jgi:chromosome partitioning protein